MSASVGEKHGVADEDIYSDVDSEGFVQDMRHYGVGQALSFEVFAVSKVRVQADGIEEDAAAYLRAVRAEAARIPHVTVGTRLHPEAFSRAEEAGPSTSEGAPQPEYDWTCDVVDNFVAARAQVQYDVAQRSAPPPECAAALPNVYDRRGWQRYITQDDAQPFAATLARMDNLLAASCLRCLATACRTAGDAPLSAHRALWMYGLMVRLERPIHPDIAAVLREVAVLAEQRRRDLPAALSSEEDAKEAAMYDTLRVLAGGYFGQDSKLAPLVSDYLRRSAQS